MHLHYNQTTGAPISFHGDQDMAPSPSIEVTDAQWRAVVAETDRFRVDTGTGGLIETAPAAPGLDDQRTAAILRLGRIIERMSGALVAGVPAAERDAWAIKEAAAAAVLADNATKADLDLLNAEAAETGEMLDDLAASILAQAGAFRIAAGKVSGVRRAARARIVEAQDAAGIEAALADAATAADAFVADLEG
ncbi:MAG: hypothetical protein AAFR17_09835 [Pseudomonadota bacterium]